MEIIPPVPVEDTKPTERSQVVREELPTTFVAEILDFAHGYFTLVAARPHSFVEFVFALLTFD